jgi:hypothetical protein
MDDTTMMIHVQMCSRCAENAVRFYRKANPVCNDIDHADVLCLVLAERLQIGLQVDEHYCNAHEGKPSVSGSNDRENFSAEHMDQVEAGLERIEGADAINKLAHGVVCGRSMRFIAMRQPEERKS